MKCVVFFFWKITDLRMPVWAGGSGCPGCFRCRSQWGRTGSGPRWWWFWWWGCAGGVLGGKALSRQVVRGPGEKTRVPVGARRSQRSPHLGWIQIWGCGDRWLVWLNQGGGRCRCHCPEFSSDSWSLEGQGEECDIWETTTTKCRVKKTKHREGLDLHAAEGIVSKQGICGRLGWKRKKKHEWTVDWNSVTLCKYPLQLRFVKK